MKTALIPIKVKKGFLDPRQVGKVVERALDVMAQGVRENFESTTKTWKHRPPFRIVRLTAYVREISTNDMIYGFVTRGTRPHVIVPKRASILRFPKNFRPKTRVRYLTSYAGSRSKRAMVFTKIVHHPGTKARQFEEVIAERTSEAAPRLMRAAFALSEYL